MWKLLVLCLSVVSATEICKLPPSLLCSSQSVAEHCGVQDECLRMRPPMRQAATPVNVTLYYESLCPGCRDFIRDQLFPTWQKLGSDVINVVLVPYGNAREKMGPDQRWEFSCQHGEEECIGNVLETCAIYLFPKNESFAFTHCIEIDRDVPRQAAEKCAQNLGIDLTKVTDCANGELGNRLEHQMAEMTDALEPPHKYTPWITVNGVYSQKQEDEATDNLLKLVCKLYEGPTPSACNRHQTVCYKN